MNNVPAYGETGAPAITEVPAYAETGAPAIKEVPAYADTAAPAKNEYQPNQQKTTQTIKDL